MFLLIVLLISAFLDSCRKPEKQILASLYVTGIRHIYQPIMRPLQEGRIRCRYKPSCSDYSIEAVERFGIRAGLALTYKRIRSCQQEIPIGTLDPVPQSIRIE